jgi:hypothetical protein
VVLQWIDEQGFRELAGVSDVTNCFKRSCSENRTSPPSQKAGSSRATRIRAKARLATPVPGIVAMAVVARTNPICTAIRRACPVAGAPRIPRTGRVPISADPGVSGIHVIGIVVRCSVANNRRRRWRSIVSDRRCVSHTKSEHDARSGKHRATGEQK